MEIKLGSVLITKPVSIFSHGSSLTLPKIVVEKCWNSTVLHGHSGDVVTRMVTRILTRMRTLLTGQVRQIKLLISTVSSTLSRTLRHFQPLHHFHCDPLLLLFLSISLVEDNFYFYIILFNLLFHFSC